MELHLPTFSFDTNKYASQRDYLMALINEGAKRLYGNHLSEVVIERINKEFLMLNDWNVNYLLVLHEILRLENEDEILVYTVRGTAAGSVICYCLGFSHLDPIKNGLHFDRMLCDYNDYLCIDFEMGFRTRNIVVKRMMSIYGTDCVSLINEHACAVITDSTPITEHTSTHFMVQDGIGSIQVTDANLEELEESFYRWNRFNFLVNETLSVIEGTLLRIKDNLGETVSLDDVSLSGLSFIDFPRKRELIKLSISVDYTPLRIMLNIKNPSLKDLIAIHSLYRPGVLDCLSHYIERRNGIESSEDEWSDLRIKEVLKDTEGILTFQEQLMSIYPNENDRAKFCLAVRMKQSDDWRERYFTEMSNAGYPDSDIVKIWDIIQNEGSYIFNKSHCLIQTQELCWGAWLFNKYFDYFMESYNSEEADPKDGLWKFKNHDWTFPK